MLSHNKDDLEKTNIEEHNLYKPGKSKANTTQNHHYNRQDIVTKVVFRVVVSFK